jgi:phosphopantothenoylcysteine decarboxylase/phosphopantothenate--cysteine ligase
MKTKILVAITGSESSYKIIELVNKLSKKNEIKVVISKNALKFINTQIFSYYNIEYYEDNDLLSGSKYIDLANWCNTFVICPATSNIISKVALGITDSLISKIAMSLKNETTKIIVPEMTLNCYDSILMCNYREILKNNEWKVISPNKSTDNLIIEIPSINCLLDLIPTYTTKNRHKTILITAGATIEPIDSFRYITNPAKGGSSYLLALKMLQEGFNVHIIKGKNSLDQFNWLQKNTNCTIETIISTHELLEKVTKKLPYIDWYISPMAVGDIHVKNQNSGKIKKKDMKSINIGLNPDILKYVIDNKTNQKVIGFAAESELTTEIIKEKITRKPVDLLVANIANNGYTGAPQKGFNQKTGTYWLVKNNDYEHPQKFDSLNKEELVDIIKRFIIFTELKS